MGTPNSMRWDCDVQGCFNRVKRPKLEQLSAGLPGRCGFSDVDAVADIGGWFLFIEWKPSPGPISVGQRLLHEHLTSLSAKIVSVIVAGNAETMEVCAVSVCRRGRIGPWESETLHGLVGRIRMWSSMARQRMQGDVG